MWRADRNGGVEFDDEMTNILNSLKKCLIKILHQIRIMLKCKLNAGWSYTHLDQRNYSTEAQGPNWDHPH